MAIKFTSHFGRKIDIMICDSLGSSMVVNDQTGGRREKGSLTALNKQIEGDEGSGDQTEDLKALDGRDEDGMKTNGKVASSAHLSAKEE